MKVDVLALGMLTCIRKAFDLIHAQRQALGAGHRPARRTPVYDMLCAATPSACSRWKAAPR